MFTLAVILILTGYSKCSFTYENYYKTKDNLLLGYYKETNATSLIGCGVLCEKDIQCKSVNFQKASGKCRLSVLALKDIPLNSQSSTEWSTISVTDPLDWVLMFQGIADIGDDVYNAWVNGEGITTDDINCMTDDVTSCTTHYRNKLADSWDILQIQEVKFAFIAHKDEKAYVTFDGTNSDLTSWFDKLKVTGSSWTGIQLFNLTGSFFSVQGDAPMRRFLISNDYMHCTTDRIISLVLTADSQACLYDQQPSYPRFLYSTASGWAKPETGTDIGFADSITISVRLG